MGDDEIDSRVLAALVRELAEQGQGGVPGNDPARLTSYPIKGTIDVVALAEAVSTNHNQSLIEIAAKEREMDLLLATGEQVTIALLSLALQAAGQPAIAMNGSQVQVVTEPHHTRARILYVESDQIKAALELGKVVVIAGFQGVHGSFRPKTKQWLHCL